MDERAEAMASLSGSRWLPRVRSRRCLTVITTMFGVMCVVVSGRRLLMIWRVRCLCGRCRGGRRLIASWVVRGPGCYGIAKTCCGSTRAARCVGGVRTPVRLSRWPGRAGSRVWRVGRTPSRVVLRSPGPSQGCGADRPRRGLLLLALTELDYEGIAVADGRACRDGALQIASCSSSVERRPGRWGRAGRHQTRDRRDQPMTPDVDLETVRDPRV